MSNITFITPSLPVPRQFQTRKCPTRVPRTRLPSPTWKSCGDTSPIPNSPGLLVRSWADSRRIASTVDLSRRFVSILFLSNKCYRAAFAEKQLIKLAERYTVSRRLLILSAGLQSEPGALLPWNIISAADQRDVDLTEERPCASFEITDLDYYDFVIVVDRNTKDRVTRMAEAYAHKSGGHLYEWERKIRLLCDFDSSLLERQKSAGVPLDVPDFASPAGIQAAMDIVEIGCEAIIRSLLAAGL